MLLGTRLAPGLIGDSRIGAVLALARFLSDLALFPALLPVVFLPFGSLASGPFIFPAFFGRLRGPWLVGFLGPRVRCPSVSKCILLVSGFSCAWGGFLFGVIPFGFDPSSGGYDKAGFKDALFRKSRSDGLDNVSYSYQWIRNDGATDADIQDATGASYSLADADEGKTIKVRVSFTDDAGHHETLTSAATASVEARPNSPATGAPTISGTVQVGETLTASMSGIADTDGLTSVAYSYQWIRNDGSSDTHIRDETGSTYTVTPADAARAIKVRATFTDDAGNEESLVSEATAQVPAIWTGTVTVGSDPDGSDWTGYSLFNGGMGSITAPDFELGGVKYAVQFVIHDQSGLYLGLKSELATAFSLYVASASFESTDASFRRGDNSFIYHWQGVDPDWSVGEDVEVALFDATEPETPANSPATGAPTISGTAQAGETLTASTSGIADSDGLTNVSYSYQWIWNDGTDDSDISGATSRTYTLVDSDEGNTIKVRVSFTDDAGNEETLTSAATGEVVAAPSLLTVSLESSPESHNGTDVFTFQIRFSEELKLSYKTLRDHAFTVDGGTVKLAKRQVKGSNIGWTITVEPDSEAAVRIVLPATTGCDATGAICTGDGRKMSNSLDFTVSGPD